MTQIADKTVTRKGKKGVKQGGKKAVVHLKKGDKITFA
jgi:ribosomal protein L23